MAQGVSAEIENLLTIIKKMGYSQPLFAYFRLFKPTLQFLQQINVKKYPSSIQCWDLNPQPLEHESPPITTRPGLPSLRKIRSTVDSAEDHV